MWFEARKQERKIKAVMVNHRRRVERRVDYFQKIRRDPAEFLQVHGCKCRIHVDAAIAKAAESQAIMRAWQGDSAVTIDRFDARAHLDSIADVPSSHHSAETADEENGRRLTYERYRVLVANDFQKMGEEKFLRQIYAEENLGKPGRASHAQSVNTLAKAEEEKKKQLAETKAAIAFSYDGERPKKAARVEPPTADDDGDGSDDADDLNDVDFDVTLDICGITTEETRELNKISAKYRIGEGDFIKFLWRDKEDREQERELKDIEDAKAALSGKQARRERAVLKQKRLLLVGHKAVDGSGATTTLRSFAKRDSPSGRRQSASEGSSSSSDDAAPTDGAVEFITAFGDEPDAAPVHGPAPPPPHLAAAASRTPTASGRTSSSAHRHASRHSSSRRRRSRTPSRSRSRRPRSRSRERRSHGRSSSRKRDRSRSPTAPRRERHVVDSPTRHSPRQKPASAGAATKPAALAPVVSRVSVEEAVESDASGSPRSLAELSVRSSMSESEMERRQVENRRRRVRRTKRQLAQRSRGAAASQTRCSSEMSEKSQTPPSTDAATGKALSLREKMRLQTQKALKRTFAKDREEQTERQREERRERTERDEEMREMSTLLRRREREKRHEVRRERDRLHDEERRQRRAERKHARRRSSSSPFVSRHSTPSS